MRQFTENFWIILKETIAKVCYGGTQKHRANTRPVLLPTPKGKKRNKTKVSVYENSSGNT